MIDTILVSLLATVIRVDGALLHLDKGLVDGLRPGDTGEIAYQLRVAGKTKTIEVAGGTLVDVSATEAVLEVETQADGRIQADRQIQLGYQVRFDIPAERTRPADLLGAITALGDEEEVRSALRHWLEREVPRDETMEALLLDLLRDRVDEGPADAPSEASDDSQPPGLVVEGGVYRIGADPPLATHYDQQPSFLAHLAPYRIDTTVFEGGAGLSFDEATAVCASRGMRLPTEFEWEIAATTLDCFQLAPLYEWTASWYQPYPGNEVPAESYGQRYRVLRGSEDLSSAAFRVRRFATPETKLPSINFRCAVSIP